MPTPAELLAQSFAAFQNANRIDGTRASYRKDSPSEYAAVMAYLNGGTRPGGTLTLMGQGFVLEEDARRALASPPPPSTYTHRFATFDPATDDIQATLNRFQPAGDWWLPGTPERSPWPNGGGLHEIVTPHGPGIKIRVTPEMIYPGATVTPSCVGRFVAFHGTDNSGWRGQTHTWEWTWLWPNAGNPAGWAQDWNVGSGFLLDLRRSNGAVTSVGHHLYLDYSAPVGSPKFGFRFGRHRLGATDDWEFTFAQNTIGEFPPDTPKDMKVEIKYSAGADGFIRVYTDGAKWVNYSGPTLPVGWSVWTNYNTLRIPRNRTQETHWVNHRLTISG